MKTYLSAICDINMKNKIIIFITEIFTFITKMFNFVCYEKVYFINRFQKKFYKNFCVYFKKHDFSFYNPHVMK